MEKEQSSALRAALHHWIDQASPEQLAHIDREVQSVMAGDRVAWSQADLGSDRLAPEAQIKAMMTRTELCIAVNG
jgi:hypothetical protein